MCSLLVAQVVMQITMTAGINQFIWYCNTMLLLMWICFLKYHLQGINSGYCGQSLELLSSALAFANKFFSSWAEKFLCYDCSNSTLFKIFLNKCNVWQIDGLSFPIWKKSTLLDTNLSKCILVLEKINTKVVI